ncbi:MAG TPA: hypothetical protein VGK73_11665 [Polyangiaceae bacterium]
MTRYSSPPVAPLVLAAKLRRELSALSDRAELRALNASAREDAANDTNSIKVWLASGTLRDATEKLRRYREGR